MMTFGVGVTTGVREYVLAQILGLCQRLCVSDPCSLQQLLEAALEANQAVMSCNLTKPLIDPVPESRRLWDFVGLQAVSPESQLIGREHVAHALSFLERGGNVLVVQNHTSGADTLVWDQLVNRAFPGEPAREFTYMAGHVVNLFLIPLLISAAVRRCQIFSTKYKGLSEAVGITADAMTTCNRRAIVALGKFCANGGRCIVLYPEGGRGDGALKDGDPKTAKIPRIMATQSSRGLLVLPTYVSGATSILPVVRDPNEFNQYLEWAKHGTATVTCGQPVSWEQIHDKDEEIVHSRIMRLIAALAPNEAAKGPWA